MIAVDEQGQGRTVSTACEVSVNGMLHVLDEAHLGRKLVAQHYRSHAVPPQELWPGTRNLLSLECEAFIPFSISSETRCPAGWYERMRRKWATV